MRGGFMFSLYPTTDRCWFIERVRGDIFNELNKRYRASFISPWWRLMFKAELERYVNKITKSYQYQLPELPLAKMLAPIEHLISKAEWESYLMQQAEKLAKLIWQVEKKLEQRNVGYPALLNRFPETLSNY